MKLSFTHGGSPPCKRNTIPLFTTKCGIQCLFLLAKRPLLLSGPMSNPTRLRLKACLVTWGDEQHQQIDYGETFTLVVKWTTLPTVIALAVSLGWPLHHMDVGTAFLNKILAKLIFMLQPSGFIVPSSQHLACLLNCQIYGLKESPQTWYDEIDSYLLSSDWTRSFANPNLYSIQHSASITILMLFVDDLLVMGSNLTRIDQIKAILQEKCQMKDQASPTITWKLTFYLQIMIYSYTNKLISTS